MKIKLTVLNEFEELTDDTEKNIFGGRRSRKNGIGYALLGMRLEQLNALWLVGQKILTNGRN